MYICQFMTTSLRSFVSVTRPKRCHAVFAAVIFLFPIAELGAQTWTGSVSTAWNVTGNWSTGLLPTASTTATIPAAPIGGRFPTISTGTNPVQVLIINSGATLSQTGGTLQIAGDWRNSGTFNGTGGTVQFTANAGTVVFNVGANNFFDVIVNSGVDPRFSNGASSVLNISGNYTNNNTTYSIGTNATFNFVGTSTQTFNSASSNNDAGNLTINKSSGTFSFGSAITTSGNFTVTNGAVNTSVSNYGLTVTGSITFSGGSFEMNQSTITTGNWTNSGATITGGACTLSTADMTRNSGTFTAPLATITISGNLVMNVTGSINAASITFTGTTRTISGQAVTLPAIIITTGSVTVNSNVTCTSLTFANNPVVNSLTVGTGTLLVNNSVTINQASANGVSHSFIVNAGSATVNGDLIMNVTTNNGGRTARVAITTGTLTIAGNVVYNNTLLSANSIIDMSGGAGNLLIGGNVTVNSLGTFTPGTTSTLTLNGTGSQSTPFTTYNNLQINKPSGVATLTTAPILSGNLTLTQGTLNVGNNNIELAGNWINNGGTLVGGTGYVSLTATGNIGGTNSTSFPQLFIKEGSDITMSNNNSCTSLLFDNASTSTTFTHTGTAALTVNGPVTLQQPTAGATYSWQINGGSATVSGLLSMTGTATNTNRVTRIVITTGTLNAFGGITLAASTNVGKVFDLSGGAGSINLKGALTAPANSGTLTAGTAGSIFNYADDVNPQTVSFFPTGIYHNLHFSNTSASGVSLSSALSSANVSGNIRVLQGTASNAGFSVSLATGKTFEVANGATYKMTTTTGMVTGTSITKTFGPTSTVDYTGTAQTVSAETYGNLVLSGSGTKTMPGTAFTAAGNFTTSGTISATAANAISINGNVTLGTGTTFNLASFTHNIGGNWTNNGATVSAGTSTLNFNGALAQTVTTIGAWNNLIVNKATTDVILGANLTINGNLNFTFGRIQTGSFSVIMGASGTVSVTTPANGWVFGQLQKNIATGSNVARTFEVGTLAQYSPVNTTFASVSVAGNLTATAALNDHPNLSTSLIVDTASVNRYWTFSNNTATFTTASVVFNWVSTDVDNGAIPTEFVVASYNGSWSYPTVSNATATSIQASGITSLASYAVGKFCVTGRWLGTINTNWNSTGNWQCGIIPDSSINVIVPTGLSNYPTIASGFGYTKNIVVQSGASVTVSGGTLQITGNINNSGTITATSGIIEMKGTSPQTIPAGSFATNTIQSLKINNTAGVTLSAALNLTGLLTITNGSLNTGGFLTLKSTASTQAQVATITSVSPTPIAGNVTVERYVPGRRKYRLMTSSVSTSAANSLIAGQEALSIWGNWQAAGSTATQNIGTSITGGTVADGFDNLTPNPSLFTYDAVNKRYLAHSSTNGKNTKLTPLKAAVGYYMFIYGDRQNSASTSSPRPTVISATGTLLTGNQTFDTTSLVPLSPVTNRYSLVGNPFAAVVDWTLVQRTNLSPTMWGWDPNLSSTGGYVTVTSTGIVAPSSPTIKISRYIQPGQAFFVQTAATNPRLVIREADKATADANAEDSVFRTGRNGEPALLAINLLSNLNNTAVLADGVVAAFDSSFVNEVDSEDGKKMELSSNIESVALNTSGVNLSVDTRKFPTLADTLFINTSRLTKPQYSWQIFMRELTDLQVQPMLEDNFLQTKTPLSLSDTNYISFDVLAGVPASSASNRFAITFAPTSTLPVSFTTISATAKQNYIQLQWQTVADAEVEHYEVYRSANGTNFNKIGEVVSRKSHAQNLYDFRDVKPIAGNNYYYVKALQTNGGYKTTKTVMAKLQAKGELIMLSNPIQNQRLMFELSQSTANRFQVVVFDMEGRKVFASEVLHSGGKKLYAFTLPPHLSPGVYSFKLFSDTDEFTNKLVLQ